MNTPNKLTLLRILLVPAFLATFVMYSTIPYNYCFALAIFVIASITDFVDGYLARKNNQITTFGKFLDPLADKMLIISALIGFIAFNLANPVAVVVIVAREFLVTSIRLIAASNDGTVIAANQIGKVKTVIQMVSIIVPLTLLAANQLFGIEAMMPFSIVFVSNILIILSAAFTAYSGIVYIIQNKSLINTTK